MAKITMDLIKELREKTHVGMMACKEALILADGDIEKAIEILRKKGAAVAAKRAEQETNNGIVTAYISADHKTGALLEVSCETDFAANTSDMKEFANTVCEHLAQTPQCCKDRCEIECLVEQKLSSEPNKTVSMLLEELIAKISENIKFAKCARFTTDDNGFINVYIHPGANLGTMVEVKVDQVTNTNKEILAQATKDICMQIAVNNPICIEPSQLDPKLLEKEQCIIKEQLLASGKPEQMIEKIMVGKINKYYEEVCLTKQKFIKQDKVTIEQHLSTVGKQANCTISIKKFQRFAIGNK